jgi:hypothetical protein
MRQRLAFARRSEEPAAIARKRHGNDVAAQSLAFCKPQIGRAKQIQPVSRWSCGEQKRIFGQNRQIRFRRR